MKILVTGSGGFIGKNLVCALNNIKDGKDRTRGICVDEVFEFDKNNSFNELKSFCRDADFVFHLAGANRPKTEDEFMKTNCGFTEELIKTLEECGNNCPVMMSSSTQALLQNPYADSKRAGESVLLEHENKFGAKAYIYRFPNVFGKWCRPNYNSAVATFCNNIANGLPIKVNDRNTLLTLVYIDDIIDEMIEAIKGNANKEGEFYKVPTEHKATLGEIVDLLYLFKDYKNTLLMPKIPDGSFAKKMFSTFLSYLPKEDVSTVLKMNTDDRGSFTEILKTEDCGQFSVNISKPGITKGQHWHNSKWELFVVVSGHGLIQQRKIGSDEVIEFEVSGKKIEAVAMLPGYTHNIINLSDSEDLVTLMWANERFNSEKPDTFFEKV